MFLSPYADVDTPDVSIYDYLFGDLTEADAQRPAFIDAATGQPTSYGELKARIDAVAGALAARGVGAGTTVGLLSANTPAFAIVFHGILRAGATVTTINALAVAAEIDKQLRDADATWLFTISPLLSQALDGATRAGLENDHLIVMDGAEGFASLTDLIVEQHEPPEVTLRAAHDVAVLPYSSGTTGVPKGVMLSHTNLVANVQQARDIIVVTSLDRVLAVLPFFHIYGMTALLNLALKQRAALVTMPRFDLEQFLSIIQNQKCTYVFVAPPIMVALAKHPMVDQFDLSSVHTMLSGAAPLDGRVADAVAQRLGTKVVQGYGMSELSPVSHVIPADRDDMPRSSIGVPVPNSRCRIVDVDTGEEITQFGDDGLTRPGELVVEGPNVMLGYLGKPEETAKILTDDGWLHTGDIAIASKDGWFAIVDRAKELIKYKGYQVAPAELEALLLTHPQIMDAAVIGTINADGDEVPKAFVVKAPGSDLTADDVMAFVADNAAPYKKVRVVEFIETVPKSSAGKILRKDLRAAEPA